MLFQMPGMDARTFAPSTVIEELAALYGVELVFSDDPLSVADDVSMAPLGSHAISPSRRALIIGCQVDRLSVYFHELIHLIVQPPFARLGEVPEEWILFQFERALSRRTLPVDEQFLVEKWQRETFLCLNSRKMLGDIPGFDTTPWWHEGYGICQTLGLLDEHHQPTFRPPNWAALDDNALKRWWAVHGPELIERQLTVDTEPAAILFEDREELVLVEVRHDGATGTITLTRDDQPLATVVLDEGPIQRPYLPLGPSDLAAGARIRVRRTDGKGPVQLTLRTVQHRYWMEDED